LIGFFSKAAGKFPGGFLFFLQLHFANGV